MPSLLIALPLALALAFQVAPAPPGLPSDLTAAWAELGPRAGWPDGALPPGAPPHARVVLAADQPPTLQLYRPATGRLLEAPLQDDPQAPRADRVLALRLQIEHLAGAPADAGRPWPPLPPIPAEPPLPPGAEAELRLPPPDLPVPPVAVIPPLPAPPGGPVRQLTETRAAPQSPAPSPEAGVWLGGSGLLDGVGFEPGFEVGGRAPLAVGWRLWGRLSFGPFAAPLDAAALWLSLGLGAERDLHAQGRFALSAVGELAWDTLLPEAPALELTRGSRPAAGLGLTARWLLAGPVWLGGHLVGTASPWTLEAAVGPRRARARDRLGARAGLHLGFAL